MLPAPSVLPFRTELGSSTPASSACAPGDPKTASRTARAGPKCGLALFGAFYFSSASGIQNTATQPAGQTVFVGAIAIGTKT